jgi:hypothetical protein
MSSKNNLSQRTLVFLSVILIVLGIISRLVPHPWNMTPLTAIALFSFAYLGNKYSWAILAIIMGFTDIILGTYDWQIMLSVYGSFALAGLIGSLVKRHVSFGSVILAASASSVTFFLITNWAVWQFSGMYELSWKGLALSYTMAIPFFKNQLMGDLLYSGMLFGAYATVIRWADLQETAYRKYFQR